MDRRQYTCLVMLCSLTLTSIHGKDEDLFPSCVKLMVPRGTAWRTAPQRPLRLQCPVKHCGESLNVTWCKLSIQEHCEPINSTEEVEITQSSMGDTLTSYLTFKAISISDDGLYRCYWRKNLVSHNINVSVSEISEEAEYFHSQPRAVQPPAPPDHGGSWRPYFFICFILALLVTVITIMNHLSFHDWKQMLKCKTTHGQAMSSCMIPDLPKRSDPSAPVLRAHFPVLNDTYRPRASGTRPTPPSTAPSGNQPQANTEPDCAVYAVINHKRRRSPGRRPQTETNNPEYSTISVS